MPLKEVIENHPQYLLIACVTWIAIGVWVVSMIGWMIQGDIDALFGFPAIGVAFVLGYFSFMPPVEVLRPFTAIATVLTVIVFPFLRQALNQRALVAIDIEAMENAYDMLRLKPDNHMQRFKLGRLLYDRGQVEAGMAVASEALQSMPENLFTDEHRMLARWRRQNPNANLATTINCIDCGRPNPASAIHCVHCGQPHLLDMARGRWVGRQFARKLIAGWVAGIIALAGIPAASQLPPAAAIAVIVAIMIGALAFVWIAFRDIGEGVKT